MLIRFDDYLIQTDNIEFAKLETDGPIQKLTIYWVSGNITTYGTEESRLVWKAISETILLRNHN